MRLFVTLILTFTLGQACLSQEIYTGRKGTRLLPGHLHIVMTVDSSNVRYELFNHWYSRAYAQLRDMTIPLDRLAAFNAQIDSINIEVFNNYVRLTDKNAKIKKKIKHQYLCAFPDYMRKISFAYEITKPYKDIHFELYYPEELELPMSAFKPLMKERLKETIEQQQDYKR